MSMKKQLLIALMTLIAGYSSAQTCNPQYQDSTFGAWPDTTTNFAPAYVNVPYVQPLDFKAPANSGDIDPQYAGGTINSYRVTSVTGLPTGFTYHCSAANCQYNGGVAGCAELRGTATIGQVGVYPITINIQAQITIPPIPFPAPVNRSFPGYKLVVMEEVGLSFLSPNEVYVYPNPASSVVNVVNAHNYETIEVYGVTGQLVAKKAVSLEEETVDISELKEGVYFLHLVKGENKSVHKFTKK